MNEPRRKQWGIVRSFVELHSGFNAFLIAPRGGVLNPSARIKTCGDCRRRKSGDVLAKAFGA